MADSPCVFSLDEANMLNNEENVWKSRLKRIKMRAQSQAKKRGMSESFRSGLELQVGILLRHLKINYTFEQEVIKWVSEPKPHRYTPDFKVTTQSGKIIFIETKGRFVTEDMQKHLAIKKQYPDIDIRFVFSDPYTWFSKAKTKTYAKWADKHGFKWCSKSQLKSVLKKWIQD